MVVFKTAKAGTLVLAVCAFALAVIIAFWSTAVIVTSNDRARTLADVDHSNQKLALTLSEHAERTLDYADRLAVEVKTGREHDGRAFDFHRFASTTNINRKLVVAITIADATGNVRQIEPPQQRLPVNFADREHFKVHVNTDSGRPFVSRPVMGRVLGRSIIVLSRRLNRGDGSFDGIVSVVIDPDVFTRFYRDVGLGDNGLIALTGLDGFVRARNSANVDGVGQDVRSGELFKEYFKHDAGTARIRNVVDGVSRRVAFHKLDNYPLVLTVGVAEDTVLATVNARAYPVYLGTAFASLLAMIAAASLVAMVRRRERDAAALSESGERYRKMLDVLPDAVIIRRDDRISYVNAAALRLFGATSPEQLIGTLPEDIIHPAFRQRARERIAQLRNQGVFDGSFEQQFLRLDGSAVDVEVNIAQINDGGVQARQIVARDISARKKIETALRDSEARYRLLVETLPDAVMIYEGDCVVYVNNTAVKLLGAEAPEQLVGRTLYELIHPDGHAAALARREYVLKTGQPTGLFEQVYMRLDGGRVEVEGSSILIPGSPTRQRLVAMRDVSARKRAEAALHESEARLRLAVEAAGMTNWEWDIASGQTHWGYGHENLLGPLPADARQYPDFVDMVYADDRASYLAAGRETIENGAPYEIKFRFVRTDGELRWMRHSGRALRDASGRVDGIAGVLQDVTRRHDIEQELILSRQRRDALLEAIPDPAWMKDLQGRYIAVNRAWLARRGLAKSQDVEGKPDREFFSAMHLAKLREEDRRVIETRTFVRGERAFSDSGGEGWVETVKSPVLDGHGNVVAIVGLSHDITARKRSEQAVQTMNESLAQKTAELTVLNKELESFAYTVSHDLRAPLRHIDGFVNLLKNHAGPSFDAQSARYFDRVSQAAKRMGLLIDDLLAFSRTSRAELRSQRVALDGLLRETIEHLAPDAKGRRIEWTIGALPDVQGDAGLLALVFQNLLGNAVKYTRRREAAQIEIREIDGDRGMATIEVRDNGVGFDMKYRHKLFGVFQRLHADTEFEGTGIGLATVARIVQRHGGRVWANGVEGKGSCFYVALPRAYREAQVA